jgi:hypothetical protein
VSDAGRWSQGEEFIEGMLERGQLDTVHPSPEHADLLMTQAEGHLAAAAPLVELHPPSAFTLLYDAARKAMTAVLAKQGLRPTGKEGGHAAVEQAIEAQMGPNIQHVVRPFRRLRARRNEVEYPSIGDIPMTPEEVSDGLTDASGIIDLMKKFLPLVGPFARS